VGFAASRVDADEGEVLSVAIAREAHGRGCAGPLLRRHLESLAPALALYRRLGFAEVGRRPGYYLRPDGSRATALTMTKLL
jgi:ribosomal-protein-alanine N-acetyltransferase